ncbi:hypothetical protein OGAPHI_003294 [Ogataea philodendri]|uniref:Major facilitator superfamily (MFS) profile domain-containing protein n=1 Tax=Ogataea philodendri TaxID=1378263 RepID=A0A9P8T689_9ASCO|nr:uncharacterized protein OGAPHI_003294 [Ogataea philodendri]KAH3666845.1 hypothetical protein OGAPHI_003294 [Ogataea philodendri]
MSNESDNLIDKPKSGYSAMGHMPLDDPMVDAIFRDDVLEEGLAARQDTEETYLPTDEIEESDMDLLLQGRTEHSKLPWYKRPSVAMICAFISLLCVGLSMGDSIEISLVLDAICSKANEAHPAHPIMCRSPEVQHMLASVQKWRTILSGLITVAVSIKLGNLSDLYGRRPVLMFNLAMLVFCSWFKLYLFVNNAYHYSTALYLLAETSTAIGGGIFITMGMSNSYLIDLVDEADRPKNLAILTAFLYGGLTAGPLVGGILPVTSVTVLKIGTFFQTFIFFLGALLLPESRPKRLMSKKRRLSTTSAQTSSLNNFFSSLKLLWITSYDENGNLDYNARYNVIKLICIDMLTFSSTVGAGIVIALYGTYKFNWAGKQLSTYAGITTMTKSCVLLAFNPWFTKFLSQKFTKKPKKIDIIDRIFFMLSLGMDVLARMVVILAPNQLVMYSSVAFSGFSSILDPVLHSAVLKYYPYPERNGEYFGCIAMIRNVLFILAPTALLTIYSKTIEIDPKIALYATEFMLVVSLGLAISLR